MQTSLAPRSNQKLAFKIFGPFQVIDKVGVVAYKLDLLASTSIHLVFHVSQLKGAVPSSHPICTLPHSLEGHQFPLKVLQRRVSTFDNAIVPRVLIQWSVLPRSLATWEDLTSLKQRFPHAPTWGEAGSKGGEGVSSQTPKGTEKEQATVASPAREGTGAVARRSDHAKRPNWLITGPEWV